MKINKKKSIFIIGISLLLLLILSVLLMPKHRMKASEEGESLVDSVKDEEVFETVTGPQAVLENEQIVLTLDTATTHFTVFDKTTGVSYDSVSSAEVAEDTGGIYTSEVQIDYYDSNELYKNMYSYNNSVAFGCYQVKATKDAVRVYYEIRESENEIFVPTVFTKEVFEEEILNELSVGQKRRITRYYKLRNAEEHAELVAQYPELKKQELYIITDSMSQTDYREVSEYIKQVAYTQERYAEDIEELEITDVELKGDAKFQIPVEYRLTEDGFQATILVEEIVSENEEYTLTEIHLLPTFGSMAGQEEGYFLVPDGSGGLISFAEADTGFHAKIYGNDEAIDTQLTTQLTQRTVMPVYGMNRLEDGFFAIIEGAESCATVRSQVAGATNVSSAIYTSFLVRSYDKTEIAAYSAIPFLNLYAQEMVSERPSVRYALLGKGHCDYSSMAAYYRTYLEDQGIFTDKIEKGMPLYLDFTGYATEAATFLSIPYDAKVILSKVEDIEQVVDSLYNDGATAFSVRLKSYAHRGKENSVNDSFQIISGVGNIAAVKELASKLKQMGGTLYLDDVVDVVYHDTTFDSFSKLTHASRKVNQMVVSRGEYDIVMQDVSKTLNTYYLISPKYYESLVENFVSSFEKKVGAADNYGYSWSGYGSRLNGDYNSEGNIDRSEAELYAEHAMSKAEGFGSIMTEGGNLYALRNADTILNVPLSDSSYHVVTQNVPFYQMVLHGYKNFAGAALNMATDAETEWLRTIECGASMYYSCMTEEYTKVKDLGFGQTLYPVTEQLCHDEIVTRYQEYAEVFEDVATCKIIKHEIMGDGLRITTYENGTMVAVNYSDQAVTWGDITVEARNFAVSYREVQ